MSDGFRDIPGDDRGDWGDSIYLLFNLECGSGTSGEDATGDEARREGLVGSNDREL
jgi:hypothetical protein